MADSMAANFQIDDKLTEKAVKLGKHKNVLLTKPFRKI